MTICVHSCTICTMKGGQRRNLQPEILFLGNSEYDRPYTKTTKFVFKDADTLFSSGRYNNVYNTIPRDSDTPYLPSSKSIESRDKKQIYNRKHLIQSQERI